MRLIFTRQRVFAWILTSFLSYGIFNWTNDYCRGVYWNRLKSCGLNAPVAERGQSIRAILTGPFAPGSDGWLTWENGWMRTTGSRNRIQVSRNPLNWKGKKTAGMKIALVNYCPYIGGAEIWFLKAADYLKAHGHQIEFFCRKGKLALVQAMGA